MLHRWHLQHQQLLKHHQPPPFLSTNTINSTQYQNVPKVPVATVAMVAVPIVATVIVTVRC